MKRTAFLLLCIVITFQVIAQVPSIKNYSFENWTDNGGYLYPDSWNAYSTEAVQSGAIARKTGGSVGAYSLHVGSYYSGSDIYGAGIDIYDTLSMPVGGLKFDCRIQNNNTQWLNGLFLTIYFYDSMHDYISDEAWSSPMFTNYNSFTTQTWSFNSPPDAHYYNLDVSYFNAFGTINEFADVDNLRFIEASGLSKKSLVNDFIYPNPANHEITISNKQIGAESIAIFNLDGALVLQQKLHNKLNCINISTLSPGLYLIQLKGKSSITLQKLIKE